MCFTLCWVWFPHDKLYGVNIAVILKHPIKMTRNANIIEISTARSPKDVGKDVVSDQ